MLDSHGVPVWYHPLTDTNGVIDVASLSPESVSFTSWDYSPYELMNLGTGKTTDVTVPNRDEHEFQLADGGSEGQEYVLISNPLVGGVDLTGLTLPLGDGGAVKLGPNGYILNCDIDVVDSAGKVTWHWSATDHLVPREDCTWPELAAMQAAPDGGLVVDTFHCNAVDVDPNNQNLLVSARAMDSVFYVERPSGRIVWKMGGSAVTKDNATFVKANDPFYRQHDARLQPSWVPACGGGAGQISLFDDETDKPGPARAAVYDVHIEPGDGGPPNDCGTTGGASSATLAWQYVGAVDSISMGSFRILPDGSRVVGWGQSETPNHILTEVDLAGNDLLDAYFVNGSWSYRAIKVPLSQFDLTTLHATAGQ